MSSINKFFKPSSWTLRTRLLVATVAIAGIGIGASDFVAKIQLRNFLIKQVDVQISNVAGGSLGILARAGMETNTGESENEQASPFKIMRPLRGVPTATTVTLLDPLGNVIGQLGGDIDGATSPSLFQGMTMSQIASAKEIPFTIDTAHGTFSTRAIAKLLPTGLGSMVVSVSLASVDRTLHELSLIFLLISFLVLLLIGLIARAIIGLSLKPLQQVEITAAAIANGDLSARLPIREPSTEVGKLTKSLNTMLSHIEESFAVRIESENKLRRFVSDASHELRTPLTAIRGFAELHRQGAVTGEKETKELIGRIENESIRMGSLVEDLLLLARMDESKPLALVPVDLSHILKESAASAQAAGPDHVITSHVPDDLYILGDEKRVHQAIANLLANARTHTPAGTTIEINAESSDDEVAISVKDTGSGLSKEDQDRIFERFFRIDPARARHSGEGSGLGLSIVDAIMKAHGGRVSVHSELGKGATFTLHFPIQAD
jgi:two-component system OmpR family sensor kinase